MIELDSDTLQELVSVILHWIKSPDYERVGYITLARSMESLLSVFLYTFAYYIQIESFVNQGKLVPEDIIFGLLTKRLDEGCSRGENGFIIEGSPEQECKMEEGCSKVPS